MLNLPSFVRCRKLGKASGNSLIACQACREDARAQGRGSGLRKSRAAQSRWPGHACDCCEVGDQREHSAEGAE